MIRRPPRSTLDRSSAASDVYKRQYSKRGTSLGNSHLTVIALFKEGNLSRKYTPHGHSPIQGGEPVSYTHLRAHETPEHLVCRLLLEKKNKKTKKIIIT